MFEFQSSARALYKFMARADIGIVPLLPCKFNEAKSNLKSAETLLTGTPVVATDLPEQRRVIRHGYNGFLAKTPKEFASYVQMLVNDPVLREDMSRAAAESAQELWLEDHIEEWEEAIGAAVSVPA